MNYNIFSKSICTISLTVVASLVVFSCYPINRPVEASEYAFGVLNDQARDAGEQVSLEYAKKLGIQTARLILPWWLVEPEQGKFKFYHVDKIINMHHEAGIAPVITLKCMSQWATRTPDGPGSSSSSPPKDMEQYERFVRTVVNRYKDKVKYWQIENEVFDNTIGNSKFWYGTKEEYIDLLKHAYSTIKAVDPEAKVVLQGFANLMFRAINEGPHGLTRDVQEFYDYIMKNAADYIDLVDFHQYYKPTGVYSEVKLLKEAMNKYGYQKEIICTEAGDLDIRLFRDPGIPVINDILSIPEVTEMLRQLKPGGITDQEMTEFACFLKDNAETRPILERYQAENLVKRVCLTFSLGVKQVHWLEMMDRKEPENWFPAIMGLIDSDGRKKPHYYTYQLLINKLTEQIGNMRKSFVRVDDINFISYDVIPEKKIIRFAFARKDPVYVVWCDYPTEVNLTNYISSSNVKIYHIVTALDARNNPIYPDPEIMLTSSIPINRTPIIVEEN